LSKNLVGVLLMLSLAACANGDAGSVNGGDEPVAGGEALVERIDILIMESFPVQVAAVLQGNLPDGCTLIDQVAVEREDVVFVITISVYRPADQICTEALVPFEEQVALDVYGLPAGVYTVTAGAVSETFELAVDNVPSDGEPEPSAEPSASISGLVWHDLCPADAGAATDGCVESEGDGYEANGILDAGEPGIAGVMVTLNRNVCPPELLATTTTDANGRYRFDGLRIGQYRIIIEAESSANESILMPGVWTAPVLRSGSAVVVVDEGEAKEGVDFGWDYALAP